MKGGPDSSARIPVETAVDRVAAVARALTSTTGGVAELQREVVRTAASIAGAGASAAIALRVGDRLTVRVVDPLAGAGETFEGWEAEPDVVAGQRVERVVAGRGSLLVLPMSLDGETVGALAVMVPPDGAPIDPDAKGVLVILANNAAVAMENARLYELERESVRRLRELDTMKTDFLATVQHELRTPLTAILGLSDLIEMCWAVWEDTPETRRIARHPGCGSESRRDRRDDHRLLGRRWRGARAQPRGRAPRGGRARRDRRDR